MTTIGPARYVHVVRRELDGLTTPAGPPRRLGIRDLDHVVHVTRNDLRWIDGAVDAGELPATEGARAACGRAREVTSLLYAAGAAHETWRHWAALSAFGLLLDTGSAPGDAQAADVAEAVQYALLAGEWSLAAALPRAPRPPTEYHAEYVVWALAVGLPDIDRPSAADAAGEVWSSFFRSVTTRNPAATTLALHTIADLHIDLFGEGWQRFVEWDHPLFDPMAGAGAALARHLDLVTDDLSDLDRRYLDAGLAVGDPPPLYPTSRPAPSAVAPRRVAETPDGRR